MPLPPPLLPWLASSRTGRCNPHHLACPQSARSRQRKGLWRGNGLLSGLAYHCLMSPCNISEAGRSHEPSVGGSNSGARDICSPVGGRQPLRRQGGEIVTVELTRLIAAC